MNERELWKSLIETWIRHREIELELLRRLERSWGESTEQPAVPVAAAIEESGAEAPEPVQEPAGQDAEESPQSVEAMSTPAAVEHATVPESAEQATVPESAEHATVPESAEQVEAAATPAPAVESSSGSEEVAPESEPEDPSWVAEVPLLLLGQADVWVGFPWDHVERVALSEEVELPEGSEYRFSLGAILQVDREEEPYSLVWTQDGGPATLSCARIGGIVTIDGAVDRSIDSVIHPRVEGPDPTPVLLTLGDFIVELRSRRNVPPSAAGSTAPREDEASRNGEPEPESEPESERQPAPEPKPEPEHRPERERGIESELQSAPEREPEPEHRSGLEPELQSESEPEQQPEPEPELDSIVTPASDVDESSDPSSEEADSIYDALPDRISAEPVGGSAALETASAPSIPIDSPTADEPCEESEPREAKILPNRLNGGRRSVPHALVAVHYLPARVAVVRMLRSAGWSVEEEAQPQHLFRRLQGQAPDVLFVEPTAPFSESTQEKLHELVASGARVVVLGSRLRPGQSAPKGVLGAAPRLHFPFTEEESRELLGYLRAPSSNPRSAG